MKFLIIIFFLVDGEPRGANILGAAVDEATCESVAVEVLEAQREPLEKLIAQGVRPVIRCTPIPEFSAPSDTKST